MPDVDGEQLADLVQHLPCNRAPSPSGMTAKMVTQLCGHSTYAWDSLACVIRLLLAGRASPASLLFASRLIALHKGARAVRPIATGKIIVRITGLAVQHTAEDHLRTILAPVQYGVAIAGGVEEMGWIAQLARLGGAALLNVNVANAFNSVTRRVILASTARWVPGLPPMVLWAPLPWWSCYHAALELESNRVYQLCSAFTAAKAGWVALSTFAFGGPVKVHIVVEYWTRGRVVRVRTDSPTSGAAASCDFQSCMHPRVVWNCRSEALTFLNGKGRECEVKFVHTPHTIA